MNIQRAIEIMGQEPIMPIGKCFDNAGFFLMSLALNEKPPSNLFLCHGIGISNAPGEDGLTIAHAWLEIGDQAFDPVWGVLQNRNEYRAGLRLSYVINYSIYEALDLWMKHDYPGPWDPVILRISDKGDKNDRGQGNCQEARPD